MGDMMAQGTQLEHLPDTCLELIAGGVGTRDRCVSAFSSLACTCCSVNLYRGALQDPGTHLISIGGVVC